MKPLPTPERWRRLAPLLEMVLDLPPDRRGPFLDKVCARDPAMRAEIEELLGADSAAGTFLASPADLSVLDLVPDDPPQDPPGGAPVVGSSIGPYRVVREIGRGGMGVVYEAEQKNPRRPVALKVILGGRHVDAEAVRLFRRETDSLARLKHPAIASIYESGCTDEGQHYFAMELVQGRTLSAYLDEIGPATSRPETRRRLELFRKIASAVAYAHQRGVIHLDLKPSNILVLETPSGEVEAEVPDVKILDFGLARITDRDAGEASAVTAIGHIRGTLQYMSPEQIRGRRDEIDVRSDVYSLGVILYRMLSGRLPYDLEGADLTEVARIVCEQSPAPLESTHDLSVIVLKALAKEPDRRYPGVVALDDDIARYLDGRPILARSPTAVYQLRKLVARHKVPFAAALALLVLLIGFAATMTLQARRIAAERDRANREAETANRVSDFLKDLFKVSNPNEARGNLITAREILDKGVEKIGAELADEPQVQASLMQTMGDVYSSLGLYSQGTPILERSVEMRRRLLGEDHLDTLASMDDLANSYQLQGRVQEAEKLYVRTFDGRRRVLGEDHPDTLATMYELASVYRDLGRFDEEEALRLHSLEIRRRTQGPDHPDTLMSMVGLANAYASQKRYADAEKLYLDALERIRRVMGETQPHTLGTMRQLAKLYWAEGRYADAEKLYRETLDGERRVLGDDHPQTLTVMYDCATMLGEQGRAGDAEPLYKETLDRRRRVLGEEHPDTLTTMNSLARIYAVEGKYDESEALLREALEKERRVLGPDHPGTASSLFEMGRLAVMRGNLVEGMAWLNQAIGHGFSRGEELANDPVLKPLDVDPSFAGLVAAARRNAENETSGQP